MATVTPGKTLYAQLGVSADADAATICSAYQSLQKLYQDQHANADTKQQQSQYILSNTESFFQQRNQRCP